MGKILDYIQEQSSGKYTLYHTKKISLDENLPETLDYDDKPATQIAKSPFAETNQNRVKTVRIKDSYIKATSPIFSYFLDGSRHVYKIDDIAIGRKIYPVLAGQIVVGCCQRPSRDEFKKLIVENKIVIALPDDFDIDDENKGGNFCRLYCERINAEMEKVPFLKEHGIHLHQMLLYKTDGHDELLKGKDKYRSRAQAIIQNEMTDSEQLVVKELCKRHLLDDEHFLIKDGSIDYNPRYSNMGLSSTDFALLHANYKHVVGVSKRFDPELMNDFEGNRLSKTISNLAPFERTKVYEYQSEYSQSYYAVWYLRLRKSDFRETPVSDIVKCEMILDEKGAMIDTEVIDIISANLIREAFPVCYGNDARWANHLYPVYLTESFCKSQYIDKEVIYKIF